MMLSVKSMATTVLGRKSAPVSFQGDAKTEAVVQAGPIIDLNVMTWCGRFSHRVTLAEQSREVWISAGAAS